MRVAIEISPQRVGWLLLLVIVPAIGLAGCNGEQRGLRKNADVSPYWPKPKQQFTEARHSSLRVPAPQIEGAELVNDDSLCMTCHETYVKSFQHNVHRGQSCEQCHGPASRHMSSRGREPGSILSFKQLTPPQRAELCLKCHEQDSCSPGSEWRTSPHAHHGVSCTDCHTSHYNVPPGTPPTQLAASRRAGGNELVTYLEQDPAADQFTLREQSRHLGAITPHVCYRCHANFAQQQDVAHAHQICGAAGFDCTTCHNAHGQVRAESRTDLCLTCHQQGSPTMAWHSSTHARYGVACADCHNPHPTGGVQRVVNISHTDVAREPRQPMSVNQPQACYKCHPQIYAEGSMPSHHPVKEGKLLCSDCHDGHGQTSGNLREPTLNQVCYRCHAEKQGPFTYEHPPVTENCGICHDSHGSVTNHLLHQPTTFLCLRCHTGHRTGPAGPNHGPLLGDVGTDPSLQRAFFGDCSQCHNQIHGSDLASPHDPHAMMR